MWIKSASDATHLCSFQKFGYASGHVFRVAIVFPTFCGSKPLISSRFIRLAETSIPSFCLSTNGCRCCYNTRSLPQGGILTRLTGSDFLIQCIPAIRHLYRRTLSRIAALEVSGSLCRFRTDNIRSESCAAVIHSVRQ